MEPAEAQTFTDSAEDEELAMLCESQTTLPTEGDQQEDEITQYLAKG